MRLRERRIADAVESMQKRRKIFHEPVEPTGPVGKRGVAVGQVGDMAVMWLSHSLLTTFCMLYLHMHTCPTQPQTSGTGQASHLTGDQRSGLGSLREVSRDSPALFSQRCPRGQASLSSIDSLYHGIHLKQEHHLRSIHPSASEFSAVDTI